MSRDAALHPDARGLYGDMLRPPTGYTFDAGVATSYSLDFETALAVPVALSMQAASSRAQAEASPLALLEGVERSLGRLAVFCEAGRIHAKPMRQSRLCALLDDMIVEAAAPRGGAFHPKVWALRYVQADAPPKLRLLILSRNLTRDISWDLSLALDGEIGAAEDGRNAPIADLFERLPKLATARASKRVRDLTASLATDLRLAVWTPPPPFTEVSFAVNGLDETVWAPRQGRRMGVVSPFCDPGALHMLVSASETPEARLVGRVEELAALPAATLARFARVEVLDELAETEDGEDLPLDDPEAPALRGLHAKCFAVERGWDTELTVGSGNATSPALVSGKNVEAFATLIGKRSAVGSVEEIFGPTGFGKLLRPFMPGEAPAPDVAAQAAEKRLETARGAIAGAGLIMACGPAADDADRTTPLTLRLRKAARAFDGVAVEVWPMILGHGHARDAAAMFQRKTIPLGTPALRDVSRFVAFRLRDAISGKLSIFALGTVIEDLPEGRDAAVLGSIIDGGEAFLRYLRLLLGEVDDPFGAAFAMGAANGEGAARSAADDMPLLEDMVRALCDAPDRLHDIDRLMTRLQEGARDGAPSPAPQDFLDLWEAFKAVIQAKGKRA
jgi:hypothetical protein